MTAGGFRLAKAAHFTEHNAIAPRVARIEQNVPEMFPLVLIGVGFGSVCPFESQLKQNIML
jgi:hypothetical protein